MSWFGSLTDLSVSIDAMSASQLLHVYKLSQSLRNAPTEKGYLKR